jgi:diaminohydroxyphosphoribosylaminopyrimidine deaminase/5-amino-6-(5-phosphoribosylamino)uracil reductase
VALEKAGGRVYRFAPDTHGHVPLAPLLHKLADEGINSLMVEGGASVLSAFFSARLGDQVVITIAPYFVGGLQALKLQGKNSSQSSLYPRIVPNQVEKLGDDIIVWGKIGYPTEVNKAE